MIRTKKRLVLCLVLLGINIAFIWGNSLLPGELSGAFSDWVKSLLDAILPGGGESSPGGGLLRKLAHFTEFTCLGLLLSWLVRMLRQKNWEQLLFPLVTGAAVAALDETIQLFVPKRGPTIKDVGIDTLGVVLGIEDFCIAVGCCDGCGLGCLRQRCHHRNHCTCSPGVYRYPCRGYDQYLGQVR